MTKRVLPFPVTEEARLDNLLRAADPVWLADLAAEDRYRRRQRRRWRTAAGVLAVGITVTVLGFASGSCESCTGPSARARVLGQVGDQLLMANRPRDAEAPFRLAVELMPDAAGSWSGLGWSRYRSGDRGGARAAFVRALELDPHRPAAQNGLGLMAFEQRDYERAAHHWQWLGVDRRPAAAMLLAERWDAAAQLIAALRADRPKDDLLAAMDASASARSIGSDLRWVLHNYRLQSPVDLSLARAWRLYQASRFAAAEQAFRKRLEADPGQPEADLGLGFSLLELDRIDEARSLFEARLAREPLDAAANHGLALSYRYEGDVERAIQIWERGLSLSPPSRAARQHLPRAYLERGDRRRAIPALLELLQRHPGDDGLLGDLRRALDLG